MFSVAPNIVFAPNMTQNAERKHRTQDTNTAHFHSPEHGVQIFRLCRLLSVSKVHPSFQGRHIYLLPCCSSTLCEDEFIDIII